MSKKKTGRRYGEEVADIVLYRQLEEDRIEDYPRPMM